jgi:RNA polymerase sigma-70 factor (ECF subfamily)
MTVDWEIVQEYASLVWKTAYRVLGHEADAADCFQETFVSAMAVARRQTVANWPGLLQRLATARALDQLRKRLRQKVHCTSAVDYEQVPSGERGPLQQAQDAELGERLMAAVALLPPQQSHAFCLRHLSDMSYERIAQELDISIDGVGMALHRSRAKLRELLGCEAFQEREPR